MIRALVASAVLARPTVALADVLEVQPVTDDVWAIVGPLEQRSPENLANNATFGLVVTPDGAVPMDPGGSWQGAEMLHAAIRTLTDQPVVYVINTGGQDHRWLGNGYWQAQDATVIASDAAVADQHAHAEDHMIGARSVSGRGAGRHRARLCRYHLRDRLYARFRRLQLRDHASRPGSHAGRQLRLAG